MAELPHQSSRPVIHAPADEYGIELVGSAKPRVRRDMCGFYEVRCTCGWRETRRYRAVAERKLGEHLHPRTAAQHG
jgi:hypothetical protein